MVTVFVQALSLRSLFVFVANLVCLITRGAGTLVRCLSLFLLRKQGTSYHALVRGFTVANHVRLTLTPRVLPQPNTDLSLL